MIYFSLLIFVIFEACHGKMTLSQWKSKFSANPSQFYRCLLEIPKFAQSDQSLRWLPFDRQGSKFFFRQEAKIEQTTWMRRLI